MFNKCRLLCIILLLPVCPFVFAESWFTLSHSITTTSSSSAYVQFWTPDGTSTSDDITGQNISISSNEMTFARLGLHYNGSLQISLSLGYTKLINQEDSTDSGSYTLTFLEPGTTTEFSTIGDASTITLNGTEYTVVSLYNGQTVGAANTEGNTSIADLKITYDPSNFGSGTYSSTLVIIFTEGNT